MAKKVTAKLNNPIQADNPAWFNVIAFSVLMIGGGWLCLQDNIALGAASFALAAVFSSISTSWSGLPTLARVVITASTLFGVSALLISIFA